MYDCYKIDNHLNSLNWGLSLSYTSLPRGWLRWPRRESITQNCTPQGGLTQRIELCILNLGISSLLVLEYSDGIVSYLATRVLTCPWNLVLFPYSLLFHSFFLLFLFISLFLLKISSEFIGYSSFFFCSEI